MILSLVLMVAVTPTAEAGPWFHKWHAKHMARDNWHDRAEDNVPITYKLEEPENKPAEARPGAENVVVGTWIITADQFEVFTVPHVKMAVWVRDGSGAKWIVDPFNAELPPGAPPVESLAQQTLELCHVVVYPGRDDKSIGYLPNTAGGMGLRWPTPEKAPTGSEVRVDLVCSVRPTALVGTEVGFTLLGVDLYEPKTKRGDPMTGLLTLTPKDPVVTASLKVVAVPPPPPPPR